jgi:C1A family cysteine protease
MKMFLLFLVIFAFTGCAIVEKPLSIENKRPGFLGKTEVFALLKANKNKKLQMKSMELSDQETVRLSRLIPLNEFFPVDSLKEFKAKKLEKGNPAMYAPRMEVDMREKDTAIKDQDNGKCTAFAGAAAMESTIGDKKVLSSWDAWVKYGVYSCDSFMKALSKSSNKICNEVYYPQYGKRSAKCGQTAHAYIGDSTYLGNDINEIVRSLNEGHLVYFGMSTPNDTVKCKAVVNPRNGFANGGHAMVMVGYYTDTAMPNEIVAIVRNSWGTDCGDNGYFYMPLSIIKKAGAYFGAWEIKKVVSDVNPVDPNPIPDDPKCIAWKRVWYAPWKFVCVKWE